MEGEVFLAKITKNAHMNYFEHQVLKDVNSNNDQDYFPKVYGGGQITVETGENYWFIIIEKLGKTLLSYFETFNGKFSLKTTCEVGI